MEKSDNILNNIECFLQELHYANLLQDSIKGSSLLKDQAFPLYDWVANYSFIYLLFRIFDKTTPQSILEFGLGQTTKVTSHNIVPIKIHQHL